MRSALTALALCAATTQAHAVTVTGTALGSFGSFDGGPSGAPAVISNADPTGVAAFRFGTGATSGLTFDGYGSSGPNVLPGFTGTFDAPFAIGGVTALKGTTTGYPSTGTSVILTTTVSLTAPVAITRTLTFTLDIGLFPGLVPGTTDADVFGTGDVAPATFEYAGQLFDLTLVGFDPDGFTNDLSLQQGVAFSGELFAQISPDPTPVPEPASLVVLGLSLASLASLGRRRA